MTHKNYSREELIGKEVVVSRPSESIGSRQKFRFGVLYKEGDNFVLRRKGIDPYILQEEDHVGYSDFR